jgi:hypothetical protein
MPKITEADITKSMTATRRGIDNAIAPEHRKNLPRLLALAERIQTILGGDITLTSGYRSPALNKAVGGSKTSAHCLCLALDCEKAGMSNLAVCQKLAKELTEYDKIIFEFGSKDDPSAGWCHVSLSPEGTAPRKQNLSAVKENGKTVYKPGFVS